MRPYLVRTGVAVDTEDCAGTRVDLCVGCVDENEVFPGDGGGDGGQPVLVSRATQPGIHWAAGQKTQLGKAPVSPRGLERRLLLTSGDGSHLDCTQMDGYVSDVIGSDAGDLLVSVPRMNMERISSPPLLATSSLSLHLF